MKPIVVARYRLKMVNFLFSILLGTLIMIRYSEAVVDECSEEYFFRKLWRKMQEDVWTRFPFHDLFHECFALNFIFTITA